MAELLILVVVAGVVLLYAADRARKLRARARQMSAMNDRLDVAAAKVDEQQERKQARVRASAELTSVMPAIKRPPLTLPGVPEPAAEPEEGPAAAEPEARPAAEAAAYDRPAAADDTTTGTDDRPAAAGDPPAAADGTPAAADAGNAPDGAGAEESPAVQAAPDAADSPVAGEGSPAGVNPPAGGRPGTADEVPAEPVRTPEGTLTMGRVIPDAAPAPKLQVTSDDTMIMPSVPGQAPAPAGEAALPPAPSRARPRASRPRAGQQSTSQERAHRD
jgi:ribonuclease E